MTPEELQHVVHENARNKGFWDANPNVGEKIALIHQELSELLQAYRDDAKAPCDKPIPLTCEEEEMADVYIRLLDLAAHRGIDLQRCAVIKHVYNTTRPHKHGRKF